MGKKKKRRLFPLFLIALLLPVLVYTSHTALSIIRQSDEEQGAFDALAARVSQDSAATVAEAGKPTIVAVMDGETVVLESFNGEDGTVIVMDASGERKATALSALSDFEGSITVETKETVMTVDFSTMDVQTATVEGLDREGNKKRIGLDRVLAEIAGSARSGSAVESEDAHREILAQYQPLHDENADFFGWLKIDDTVIDYPVMFTPEESEYYLHRDFDGEYSYSGTPFVEGHCREDGNYFIIYAHHMKNGTMFGTLPKYADQKYWEAHPVILFDTLYERREYRVAAAFMSKVYGERETGVFRYYEYTDLSHPRTFDEYVSQALAAALYDTGIEIEYGDELLALSTCNYHTTDGRFVVVAKRIDDDEEQRITNLQGEGT